MVALSSYKILEGCFYSSNWISNMNEFSPLPNHICPNYPPLCRITHGHFLRSPCGLLIHQVAWIFTPVGVQSLWPFEVFVSQSDGLYLPLISIDAQRSVIKHWCPLIFNLKPNFLDKWRKYLWGNNQKEFRVPLHSISPTSPPKILFKSYHHYDFERVSLACGKFY